MNSETQSLVPVTQQAESAELTVDEVRESLSMTEKGQPANTIGNCRTVFCQDPLLRRAIRLNLLTDRVDIVRDLGWRRSTSALTDTDVKYLLLYFEQNYCLTSEKKLMAALSIVANENCYHPIQDVLNGLVWDGIPRIRSCLHHFLGADEATMWKKCSNTFCWEPSAGCSILVPSMRNCSVWWAGREPESLPSFASWLYRMSGSLMT